MDSKQLLGLFPLASLIVLVAAWLLARRRVRAAAGDAAGGGMAAGSARPAGLSRATTAWWLAFVLAQAFLAVWGALGLISSEPWAPAAEAVCAAVFGSLVLLRERLFAWLGGHSPRFRRLWNALMLLAACLLSFLAIELPWNDLLSAMAPQFALLECAIILLAMLAAFFLCQRHGAPVAGISAACLAIGIAQFFVKNFKNASILPSDLFALGTAAAVSAEYDFSIYESVLVAACAFFGACLALAYVRPQDHPAPAAEAADAPIDAGKAETPAKSAGTEAGRAPAGSAAAAGPQAAASAKSNRGGAEPSDAVETSGSKAASVVAPGGMPASAADRKPGRASRLKRLFLRPAARSCAWGVFFLAALVAFVTVPSYFGLFGLRMQYWKTTDCYKAQGFLPSFIAVAQDLPIRKPDGYSDQKADALMAEERASYEADGRTGASAARKAAEEQFSRQKPDVICIMNETFSDLSKFEQLHAGYEGPRFFKSIPDCLSRGELAVSVQGGGTCNTEFSFLTGNSMAYIGAGKYPYSLYGFKGVDSLASQFGAMGYHTTAMHPNFPSNWNRGTIYPEIGFDDFQSLSAFDNDERWHSGVTDAGTYQHCLDIINSSDEPQFIFDVTMQNHGGYLKHDIPAGELTHYQPADYMGPSMTSELNEYLSCIQKSDEELEEFIGELRQLDRPVVIVFFGDHQPTMSSAYNNLIYPDEEDQMAHLQRIFATDYVIWANYDVAGNDQVSAVDDASVNYLGAMLCQLIGADVTDYQAAQLQARLAMPELDLFGYKDVDGHWHETSTSLAYASSASGSGLDVDDAREDPYAETDAAKAAAEAYRNLSWLQYRTFGEIVS